MAATRVILTLLLFLFCVSLASSDLKIDEGKKHHSEAFHVFSRGTDRNLMQDTVLRLRLWLRFRLQLRPQLTASTVVGCASTGAASTPGKICV
ncbi:Hypothetical predicted protein [Olea europaea subsp. europaea]|uniref:Uncharacterized protein n=1 Tax=Olea europaea subsp. europaea TaxID=158383 RepID=A0A8S0PG32_OLEEU|nr:Hypothetical predicted protein [Olea europaea subsp. europaea]